MRTSRPGWVLLALLALAAGGCGLKGDLYLPPAAGAGEPAAAPPAAPPASTLPPDTAGGTDAQPGTADEDD